MMLRYKNRRVTIIGISYGFAVVTRMLQRYPELVKKVDLLISAVGFVHHEDFVFKKPNYYVLRYGSSIFSHRLTSATAKHLFLRPAFIRASYKMSSTKNPKAKSTNSDEQDSRIAFEIHLWRINDLRTYMYSTNSMLKLNLCERQVDLPVHHVFLPQDGYFNNDIIEQHLGVIYSRVDTYGLKLVGHTPSLTSIDDSSKLIPMALRKLLAKQ